MSNTTPQELLEAFDHATGANNRATVGRTDAVYHVGKLLSEEWTPEFLSDVQNTLADASDPDYDPKYHYGYLTAWNTIAGLVKGESLKTIAKSHG